MYETSTVSFRSLGYAPFYFFLMFLGIPIVDLLVQYSNAFSSSFRAPFELELELLSCIFPNEIVYSA